ncbi:S8 family serine peptidase [Kitasatospora sp. NPDC096147]|uniref:S8 family serine peptidase n=1 Tax=Kitasatospora sp. NPDC096147 TaxID=3364093 RepID=UPI00380A2E52
MTLKRTWRALGATTLAAGLLATTAPLASADAVRDGQWSIQQFDLVKAWGVSKGDGVIVAVIDSGLDPTHPDLVGQVLPGYDPGGQGRELKPAGDGHGTSMASVIAAKGHGNGEGMMGVAPGAKILPIYKNSADNLDAIPKGIRWAADNGAKVINISQGTNNPVGTSDDDQAAINYALSKDVLVVVAAGNEGASQVSSPANLPGVLAVGGAGKNGKIWAKSNSGPEVLVVAPADEVVSAGECSGSKYCLGNGTSPATAFVSGTAALLRAKYPKLSAGQIANRIVKSAKAPAGVTVPDVRYGYGLIRPYEALTLDIPAGPVQGPLAVQGGTPTSPGDSKPTTAAPTAGAGALGGTGVGTGDPAPEVKDSDGFGFLGKGLAIGAAVLVGLLLLFVLVIVLVVRAAKRRRTPAPPSAQGLYGPPQPQQPYPNQPYGQQPPAPGYPPYGNQAPQQPPYQNPYGTGGNQ